MVDEEKLAPHVEDIARVLGNNADRDEIERELRNYLDEYRIPLSTAKQMIMKKRGARGGANGTPGVTLTLSEVKPDESSVDLLVRFVTLNPRDVQVNGEAKPIFYGILGDHTGTIPFTAWETEGWEFQKGDVVKVQNAYTKEWKGQPQVNFGTRTFVTKAAEDALPKYKGSGGAAVHVADLRDGLSGVSTTVRIITVERREVMVKGEGKVVFSGIIADGTGQAQFSAWSDLNLNPDDVISVSDSYVKAWRGIPQLTLDDSMSIEKLKDTELPPYDELAKSFAATVDDIAQRGGACNAQVNGIVIDVKQGSGLIFRCPDCRRVLQKNICRIHGEVEGEADLRIKAIVDDGTGALTTIIGKEPTERILGMSLEESIQLAKDSMSHEVIKDKLNDILIAKPVSVSGDVTSDEFGLMMVARATESREVDVESEARKLLDTLEGEGW